MSRPLLVLALAAFVALPLVHASDAPNSVVVWHREFDAGTFGATTGVDTLHLDHAYSDAWMDVTCGFGSVGTVVAVSADLSTFNANCPGSWGGGSGNMGAGDYVVVWSFAVSSAEATLAGVPAS